MVEAIAAICDEFESYGWRRRTAPWRRDVNHKKIRRLMREHDLQPRRRQRLVATTDSDRDEPIYPNRTKDLAINGFGSPISSISLSWAGSPMSR
ncbi:IS3 family transposase [Bradyrhizobium diazoefficiens]|nr:IS3 family transposase [Bradyrhizobium diazoefficiens]